MMSHTESDELIIQQSKNWIRSIVIDLNLCPFAKREVDRGSLRMQVSPAKKMQAALENLMEEFQRLDLNPKIETTLLIFPSLFNDFFEYLDFVDLAEQLLVDSGYEGIYQLASFHPAYCFGDLEFDDPANYTNRSPYPMLHLLREKSVEKAIDFYGDTGKIFEANVTTMRKLGLQGIKRILDKV